MIVKAVGIMQPYIFPYLGYFQLINAVQEFVFYDDVNYIKKGWINRNNILCNGKANLFTVPLEKPSQNMLIKDTYIKRELYDDWVKKTLKMIHQSYFKAPFYNEVYPILENVFFDSKIETISDLSILSIIETSKFLDLKTNFHLSSISFSNSKDFNRAERLVSITNKLKSTEYINSIGGIKLYNKPFFKKNQINLSFIESNLGYYKQFRNEFIPGLSIIDILMFNNKEQINSMLKDYKLV